MVYKLSRYLHRLAYGWTPISAKPHLNKTSHTCQHHAEITQSHTFAALIRLSTTTHNLLTFNISEISSNNSEKLSLLANKHLWSFLSHSSYARAPDVESSARRGLHKVWFHIGSTFGALSMLTSEPTAKSNVKRTRMFVLSLSRHYITFTWKFALT